MKMPLASKGRAHAGGQGRLTAKRDSKAGPVLDFVRRYLCPPRAPGGREQFTPSGLIAIIQVGLPVKELEDLRASLDIRMEELAPKLGISRATLHRRKAVGRLGRDESDRVLRYARLMGKAVQVFENELAARRWLKSPQIGLGGAVPLDYAETEVGAREVEDLLGRIEYGVYS
jgi:putative toxin-antitoxin system antitoxin component (TIGR02293 family)